MKVEFNYLNASRHTQALIQQTSSQPRFSKAPQPTQETPMWESTDDKGIKASCTYNDKTGRFTVKVEKNELTFQRSFPASYDPVFGMDVEDSRRMLEIAERLAQKVEKHLADSSS